MEKEVIGGNIHWPLAPPNARREMALPPLNTTGEKDYNYMADNSVVCSLSFILFILLLLFLLLKLEQWRVVKDSQ